MGNYTITFYGTEESNTSDAKITCYLNKRDEIFIELNDNFGNPPVHICLDKSTAIKFAKTLRTEINKIGGING